MEYLTVKEENSDQFVEKKSRFIGTCRPVKTEEEALARLKWARETYWDATHNVYAYLLRGNIMRYSDDGEPSGTAGVPVLEVLNKEGLTDVAVVVTRYFGGTLLGAGGLVRAYGKTAKLGVDKAKITEKIYCHRLSIQTPYDLLGKVRYLIETGDYILGEIEYTDSVTVTAFVKYDLLNRFLQEMKEATNAAVTPEIIGEMYIDNVI